MSNANTHAGSRPKFKDLPKEMGGSGVTLQE